MAFRSRSLLGALVIKLLTSSGALAATTDEHAIRTFEFSAYRTNILLTDDDAMLFDWSIDQYFEEMRAQEERGDEGPPPRVEWVAPYDGIVWGRNETNLAAQWYGERKAGDKEYWTFFKHPARHEEGFRFPAPTRLMGITDEFVWQGWCNVALDFYAPEHRDEFRHIWVGLAMAQQIFLSCTAPDEAFRRFAVRDRNGEFNQSAEESPDGGTHRRLTFRPQGGGIEYVMLIEPAAEDTDLQPPAWRFVLKNLRADESLVFFAEWRETTSDSTRTLPAHPRDTLRSHHDIERIDTVGVRDRSGLGLWGQEYPQVEYLKVTPGVAVLNWFSADPNRLFTNGFVFLIVLLLLWKEHVSHQYRQMEIRR